MKSDGDEVNEEEKDLLYREREEKGHTPKEIGGGSVRREHISENGGLRYIRLFTGSYNIWYYLVTSAVDGAGYRLN